MRSEILVAFASLGSCAQKAVPYAHGDTSGCGKTHLLSGITQYRNIASRSYSIHLPTGYAKEKQYPLILGFHGSDSIGLFFEVDTGLSLPLYTANKIVVYPNGIEGSWGGPSYARTTVTEDLDFVSEILRDVRANFCIDSARIYATGISNGGGFLDSIACNKTVGGEFAAFAAAAGSFYTDTNITKNDCKPARPLTPFLEFHGLADESVHYTGGQGEGGLEPAISDWLNWWALRNNCQSSPSQNTTFGGDVVHFTWKCATSQGNGALQHWRVGDMKHVWPSRFPNFSQLAASDKPTHIQASCLAIEFFDKFFRPSSSLE